MRKKTASRADFPSTFRIHEGSSANALTAAQIPASKAAATKARCRRLNCSRKYFNPHLLCTDVVCDVLSRNGQLVSAGDAFLWNRESAGVSARCRIPSQRHRDRPIHASHQRASAFGSLDLEIDRLSALIARAVEFHAYDRRFARNHERLGFAIGMSDLIS